MIRKARKKPVEIEYMQYTGFNKQEIYDWSNGKACDVIDRLDGSTYFGVNTLEGCLIAEVGSYIVKGVEGEFYPVDPDIFKKTYEVLN
ncbi:TPA: hypothetical protein PR940_001008 [Staphylococcus aureus]|nr:hypothetical protein [Staphylococcus aureus]HDK3925035.1 hypothetical protein [Staphylococcus aureus]